MEISAIKTQLSISTILQYYGLKPDKNAKMCCPFHEDKTPSMQVYYKTQTAYCFFLQLQNPRQKYGCDRFYNAEGKYYETRGNFESTGNYKSGDEKK